MKCRPGDMAVVLKAFHSSNVGAFVQIIAPYNEADRIKLGGGQAVWWVESKVPLTWTRGCRLWHGTRGPVPEAALQPIRELAVY